MKTLFPRLRSRTGVLGPLAAAFAALLVVAGCGGGGGSRSLPGDGTILPPQPGWEVLRSLPVQPAKKWTFLVFMNAANNLEPFSGLNINQMERIGTNNDVNIAVQVKRIANRYDSGSPDWADTKTRRLLIENDTDMSRIRSQVLEVNDTADMGVPDTLQQFVQWGVQHLPAERYCLVIWNHGAGWRSSKPRDKTNRGVSEDDTTGNKIDTIALPAAIDFGRRWDLVAMDASLMQMVEVAYEIRDKAQWIVGSEESPPGEGYPYDTILTKLAANPGMDGRALGQIIAEDLLTLNGPNSEITQSVLDASKVAAIAPAVNSLGRALLDATTQYGAAISQARSAAEEYTYPENKDLIHFTQLLVSPAPGGGTPRVPDPAVQAAVAEVQRVVQEAVVFNRNGRGHPNSNGLAIYLPTPREYNDDDRSQVRGFGQPYRQLSFANAAPNWQAFLVNGPD